MKTKTIRAVTIAVGIVSLVLLSSYRPASAPVSDSNYKSGEYNTVQTFVFENVCEPLSKNLKNRKSNNPNEYFSRCPSGYIPDIASKRDSVKTNRFVDGRIVFYKGCNENYICDFKVCVDKGLALVKSKGSNEYMNVKDWIKMKNQRTKAAVKG